MAFALLWFCLTESEGVDFEEFVTIMVNYLKDPADEEADLLEAFQVWPYDNLGYLVYGTAWFVKDDFHI